MRPLNRPMFRYGGPIKEGIMSGIKEPVRKAALVGNSVYPQTGGREHHNWVKTLLGFGTRAGAGTGASQATKKTVGTEAAKGIKSLGTKIKNWWQKTPSTSKEMVVYDPKKLPPGIGTNRWYWEKGVLPTAGAVKWTAGKVAPYATTGGLLFAGGMWLRPDGTPATKEEIKNNVKTSGPGKVPGANSDLYWQDPEKAKLRAEKLRNERIQKYRDIMDIKGMNKEAAANSLIEASRLINESQDFKGDIKSGKLINQIIQGASKAFDKPADTKKAIDTLILKGEIEKDIKSAIPTEAERAAAAFGISKEEYKNKLLGKNTPAEYIATLATKTTGGKANSALVSQGYKSAGIIPKATIKDSIVDEWIEDRDGKTEIDYVKEVISKADGFGPGLYVVGDRAVLFDGNTYRYDY